jgi:putative hydrolase of the HAD superfamily
MAVLFDVDDTLVDHSGAERAAALSFRRRFSAVLAYPGEEFAALWHRVSEKHFASFTAGECSYQEQRRRRIREFFGPEVGDSAADALFDAYLTAYRQNWRLFPDVLPCLDALAGEALGIISNNGTEATLAKLSHVGLAERFADVTTPENAGASKPDARIFRAACARLGTVLEQCLYVGDRLDGDARAAQAAGMRGVWINRGGEGVPGVDTDGVIVIGDLRDLPEVLRGA